MTAISGTRRKAQELSDGTLRVMVDIDPRFKAEFHRLFPNIDTPCAIAPLVNDFERIEQKELKGGALCRLAAMWCKDQEFQEWVGATTEEGAATIIRESCEIKSRSELDHNQDAADVFNTHFRSPYRYFLENGK